MLMELMELDRGDIKEDGVKDDMKSFGLYYEDSHVKADGKEKLESGS